MPGARGQVPIGGGQRIDRKLAARCTCYMKELRTGVVELENRINHVTDERRALWQRLEVAFNDRMLARHTNETISLR
jgi:hypothetical protein